jgi:hypothetical protein
LQCRRDLWHDGHAVRIRDFLLAVYDALGARLPKPLRKHEWRVRWSLLQVYFESPNVHYEVWVQKQKKRIELGLHFEGEQEENYRWAAALGPRALEIQAQLGPSVELEEWTQAWTRLHETITFEGNLTESLAAEIAGRLAQFIEVLEPIRAEERAAVAS